MTNHVSTDTSEFQVALNDSYPHDWVSFRVCDGDYLDHKVRENLAWSKKAHAAGKLVGFTGYCVFRPGKNADILAHLDGVGFPKDQVVMIDAETWGGQISGNQSSPLNELATHLRARQGGDADRVWGYANRGDFASMWPTRPPWMKTVVASYGGSKPDFPNLVGWQYTDGQYDVPGLPSASAPFGKCDHNVFYIAGADSPAAPTTEGDDDMKMIHLAAGSLSILIDGNAFYLMQNGDRDLYRAAGVPDRTVAPAMYQSARGRSKPFKSA